MNYVDVNEVHSSNVKVKRSRLGSMVSALLVACMALLGFGASPASAEEGGAEGVEGSQQALDEVGEPLSEEAAEDLASSAGLLENIQSSLAPVESSIEGWEYSGDSFLIVVSLDDGIAEHSQR